MQMNRKTYCSYVNEKYCRRMDTSSQLQEAKAYIGRILYDIPCKVCQDHSSGKHYGIFACDGCAGFFKRSIRRQRQYVCKAKAEGSCIVDKTHRNQCRACRLRKCVHAGMNKDAVQHERGPRNSTLRRQMALYYKERHSPPPPTPGVAMPPPHPTVLDLALPKGPRPEHPHPLLQASSVVPAAAASFFCSPAAFAAAMPKFPIGLPSPFPAETVRETAARVLFMNVTWVKSVPAFTGLDLQDQLALLEQSWRELFVLGAAQFMLPLELAQLASMSSTLLHEVKAFQDTLAKFRQLRVDAQEYTYMKLIVLFKSGGAKVDVASVAALQDQTQLALSKHVATTHPDQPLRFGKLLLLLPTLRCIAASTIEELFFRRTIGHIHIERIICDMYKASDL